MRSSLRDMFSQTRFALNDKQRASARHRSCALLALFSSVVLSSPLTLLYHRIAPPAHVYADSLRHGALICAHWRRYGDGARGDKVYRAGVWRTVFMFVGRIVTTFTCRVTGVR